MTTTIRAFADLLARNRAAQWSRDSTSRGYIAGEFTGIVTVSGVPAMREVGCFHRESRTFVERGFSDSTGAYRFDSLPIADTYDIIGRDWTGTYNDVIVAAVLPEPYDVQSATGSFTVNDTAKTLDGAIDIYGGEPGHTVAVTSGAAPTGITFSIVTDGPPTYDHAARWLIAAGTAAAGSYTWTLTVTAPNGTSIPVSCTATFT